MIYEQCRSDLACGSCHRAWCEPLYSSRRRSLSVLYPAHTHTRTHTHTHTVCDPTLATGSLTINSIEHSPKTHLPAASTQLPVIYYNIISCRSDWQCLQLACLIHRHFTNKKMNPCLRMFQAPIWRLLAQHKVIINTFPMHMLHDQSSTKL